VLLTQGCWFGCVRGEIMSKARQNFPYVPHHTTVAIRIYGKISLWSQGAILVISLSPAPRRHRSLVSVCAGWRLYPGLLSTRKSSLRPPQLFRSKDGGQIPW